MLFRSGKAPSRFQVRSNLSLLPPLLLIFGFVVLESRFVKTYILIKSASFLHFFALACASLHLLVLQTFLRFKFFSLQNVFCASFALFALFFKSLKCRVLAWLLHFVIRTLDSLHICIDDILWELFAKHFCKSLFEILQL